MKKQVDASSYTISGDTTFLHAAIAAVLAAAIAEISLGKHQNGTPKVCST